MAEAATMNSPVGETSNSHEMKEAAVSPEVLTPPAGSSSTDGMSKVCAPQTVSGDAPDASAGAVASKKQRVPRRILHFSDGQMEEYSTEEEDEDETDRPSDALVQLRATDPKSLHWLPWAWYWMRVAGHVTVNKLDTAGEKLAYVLGITSPKYQYELEEYYAMKQREEEEQKNRDLESAGWTPGSALTSDRSANRDASTVKDNQSQSGPAAAQQPITSPPGPSGHA